MDEIKIGRDIHYKYEPKSGFWVSQLPTDPMSATMTIGEVIWVVKDAIKAGKDVVIRLHKKINELEAFVAHHEEKEAKSSAE